MLSSKIREQNIKNIYSNKAGKKISVVKNEPIKKVSLQKKEQIK